MIFGTDVLGALKQVDARIWQAVVGGGFVALSWLLNGWRNRRDAQRGRAERLRDVHKAIYAEIKAYVVVLNRDDLDDYAQAMVARMRQGEPGGGEFIPFIPIERNETVFRAIVGEIHVLPRATIDSVVLYYSQLEAISALVEDMRSDAFVAIGVERRVKMYLDYINMKKMALEIGEVCLEVIAAYASGGKDAAQAIVIKRKESAATEKGRDDIAALEGGQISSPVGASSDP